MKNSTTWAILFACGVVTTGSLAWAADDKPKLVIDRKATKKDDKKKDGVDWRINTAATLNLGDNRSVVGQLDGSTITFGFKFDSAVDYRHEGHEWRNSAKLAAGITRTPQLDAFVKAQDSLELESIYLYHVSKWWGPFARFAWATPMLLSVDQRAEQTAYTISNLDGSSETVTASSLRLTDMLSPSRLKESVGLYAQPIAKKPFNLEFRLGAGGRQTFAKGQRALADDEATAEVEVVELDDVLQFGAEAVLELWGTFHNKKVNYKVTAEMMTPFLHNDLPTGDDRNALDLSNLSAKAELSFKLVKWASLDYSFKSIREPQLIDEVQLQNQLLLSLGLTASGGPKDDEKSASR